MSTLTPIGSYDDWSRFCREPLIWLGEPDPAASLIRQVKDNTDNEVLGVFLKLWRKLYGDESMTVREVMADALNEPQLLEIIHELPVTDRDSINPNKLGHYLKDHRGVRVNGLRIDDGHSTERKSWRVLTDEE